MSDEQNGGTRTSSAKLYAVRVAIDVVIAAPSDEEAIREARSTARFGDEAGSSFVITATRIRDKYDLPAKWDMGCYPYGDLRQPEKSHVIGWWLGGGR